jgi:geranylgeranyl diphosphate synthase, type II
MKEYKKKVHYINECLEKYIISKIQNSEFKEITTHSLAGGKRLRSVLSLIIGESICSKINIDKLAVSVELLHNASLIIDDMPCMDNDKYRRGKETTHYKFGQKKAQMLVVYFLKQAFRLIHENYVEILNSDIKPKNFPLIFLEIHKNINDNLGFLGAASGQYIDTCPMNKLIDESSYKENYNSLDSLLKLIHLKTTTFFEISFVPSYLMCGGSMDNISILKDSVKYFGLAFQISDDFEDVEQDSKRVNNEYNPNIICKFGVKKTKDIYLNALKQFNLAIGSLEMKHSVFQELCVFLNERVSKYIITENDHR